jgi:hypothetical protein
MMNFEQLSYDICRRYVIDQRSHIPSETLDKILGWIRSRDIARLSAIGEHIPDAYASRDSARIARQIAAFFKKNAAFSNPTICKTAAEIAFFKAETLCGITNRRLDHFYFHRNRIKSDTLRADIERAEYHVSDVLGEFSDFFSSLPERIRFTSGATSTRSRRQSLPYLKVRVKDLPATPCAQPYLRSLAAFWGFKRLSFQDVYHNRVETVPKNWKTDRTIACEPEGNLTLQLALDSYIKEKLRSIGVNLSDQFKNQALACEGSINDELVTLDLSMASDTVSFNTVSWLLPHPWFKFANSVRTAFGRGFGKRFKYEKFSSMGNGCTFTIESLIFAALCKASGARKWAVYGDDLIVNKEALPRLLDLLKFFGFRINQDKSYTSGPFRESCGADWFKGSDITPFYLRCESNLKTEICHILNGLGAISHPDGLLEELIGDIFVNERLPFVPWNESSISGVWLCHSFVYDQRLIRNHHQVPQFKAFVPRIKKRKVFDSRTLFLWYLDANRRKDAYEDLASNIFFKDYITLVEDCSEMNSIIRSSVPIFAHKYMRKWVSWRIPARLSPDHLFWLSDYLIRRKADVIG